MATSMYFTFSYDVKLTKLLLIGINFIRLINYSCKAIVEFVINNEKDSSK